MCSSNIPLHLDNSFKPFLIHLTQILYKSRAIYRNYIIATFPLRHFTPKKNNSIYTLNHFDKETEDEEACESGSSDNEENEGEITDYWEAGKVVPTFVTRECPIF